jgi:hypothetical protein
MIMEVYGKETGLRFLGKEFVFNAIRFEIDAVEVRFI